MTTTSPSTHGGQSRSFTPRSCLKYRTEHNKDLFEVNTRSSVRVLIPFSLVSYCLQQPVHVYINVNVLGKRKIVFTLDGSVWNSIYVHHIKISFLLMS